MKCADAAMSNKVDLNLLYSGGSGGFLLLHLLLLLQLQLLLKPVQMVLR
jgi:hypothetical protein